MAKLSNVAFALMVAFALATMIASAIYTESPDPTKTQFYTYSNAKNISGVDSVNGTMANTQNSVTNMQTASEDIAETLATATQQLSSKDVSEQILGAFGVGSALTIKVAGLLLAILLDGFNFFAGISMNVAHLPTPWNNFANITGLGLAMFVVFAVFKIAAVVLKWEI